MFVLMFIGAVISKAQTISYEPPGVEQEVAGLPMRLEKPVDSVLFEVISILKDQGFLYAKAELADLQEDTLYIKVELGQMVRWGILRPGNLTNEVSRKIRLQSLNGKPFNQGSLDSLYSLIVQISEQQGYPFASVALDSIRMVGSLVNGVISYDRGPPVTYGDLKISTGLVKPEFLQSYLNLNKGKRFSSDHIEGIPQMLDRLEFIELTDPPTVSFEGENALVSLNLERQRNNLIDAIIGVLPGEREGDVLITGQVDLELSNLFNSGKEFQIHWKSFRPKTQDLLISYWHPALFRSVLDLGVNFSILKQDTTFLNRRFFSGVSTRSLGPESFQFFLDLNSSRSIGSDDLVTSFNMNYAGIAVGYNSLDRQRFPRKGVSSVLSAAVGIKSLRSGGTSDESSTQSKIDVKVEWFNVFRNNYQLYLRGVAGGLFNNQLFINDAYRIGGLQSLRGFNENEFFATRFGTLTFEFRVLLKSESYLYTFFDQGFLDLDTEDADNKDTPYGFGFGALLNAGPGKLNLAFAVGESNRQPLSVDFSKLHFGYVVVF